MAKKKQNDAIIGFVALGCPKNIFEMGKILAKIVYNGFLITVEPENANVVVINTCGFIAPDKAEAIEEVKNVFRDDIFIFIKGQAFARITTPAGGGKE